jgi:hypothetical protein
LVVLGQRRSHRADHINMTQLQPEFWKRGRLPDCLRSIAHERSAY